MFPGGVIVQLEGGEVDGDRAVFGEEPVRYGEEPEFGWERLLADLPFVLWCEVPPSPLAVSWAHVEPVHYVIARRSAERAGTLHSVQLPYPRSGDGGERQEPEDLSGLVELPLLETPGVCLLVGLLHEVAGLLIAIFSSNDQR